MSFRQKGSTMTVWWLSGCLWDTWNVCNFYMKVFLFFPHCSMKFTGQHMSELGPWLCLNKTPDSSSGVYRIWVTDAGSYVSLVHDKDLSEITTSVLMYFLWWRTSFCVCLVRLVCLCLCACVCLVRLVCLCVCACVFGEAGVYVCVWWGWCVFGEAGVCVCLVRLVCVFVCVCVHTIFKPFWILF